MHEVGERGKFCLNVNNWREQVDKSDAQYILAQTKSRFHLTSYNLIFPCSVVIVMVTILLSHLETADFASFLN